MSFRVLKIGSRGRAVKWLKGWLNVLVSPSPNLKIARAAAKNEFDQATADAVTTFERANDIFPADGIADARTVAEIWEKIAPSAWLANTSFFGGPLRFDRSVFFEQFVHEFGVAKQETIQGLGRLLGYLEWDADIRDVRWAAYMLATVRHECGETFQPIKELGCKDGRTPVCTPIPGNSRSYGDPVACPNLAQKPARPCPAGKKDHTYYGRGYVQLTHDYNYATMSQKLYGDARLVHSPESVLEPDTAYQIMSLGMRDGLFVPRQTLARYIPATRKPDYKGARRIINGQDKATTIAGYAKQFEAILNVSLVAAPAIRWQSVLPPGIELDPVGAD